MTNARAKTTPANHATAKKGGAAKAAAPQASAQMANKIAGQ